MSSSGTLPRRRFIQLTSAVVLCAPLAGCSSGEKRWRFFTPDEAKIAEAVADRIIPGDEDPGALEAGVVHYLDRKLAEYYTFRQDAYHHGLSNVEKTSQVMHQKSFLDLTAEEKDRLLRALESGRVPEGTWTTSRAREFFNLIRDHTMQGYYGSPRHGGNRGFCSWRMLGLPHPPLRGRMQYDKAEQETIFG